MSNTEGVQDRRLSKDLKPNPGGAPEEKVNKESACTDQSILFPKRSWKEEYRSEPTDCQERMGHSMERKLFAWNRILWGSNRGEV